MTDTMTPADIAAMQADALAGTPGDWSWETDSGDWENQTLEGLDTVLWWDYDLGFCFGSSFDRTRIARVPRMEATIIAMTETNAAQAAEIERLRDALADIIPTDRLHGCTAGSKGRQIWHDGESASIARAALKGTPK